MTTAKAKRARCGGQCESMMPVSTESAAIRCARIYGHGGYHNSRTGIFRWGQFNRRKPAAKRGKK